jgi:hypothetical protein
MDGIALAMSWFAAALLICSTAMAADLGSELLKAARNGQADKVTELLGKGAPVDAKDKKQRTPLMQAADNGHAEVVRLLIEKGADADLRDRDGWTAFGLAIFASTDRRDEVLRELPSPPKLRLVIDAQWTPENLYSSCLMPPEQLSEHVAGIQPEMVAVGAMRDVASISAKRMVELSPDQTGDAVLSLKVRPAASCAAQQPTDKLGLAIDARLVRMRDQAVLHEKTYGGGLKGLHARYASSPAQYAQLYADWARNHATSIYWAVLEAWLRASP